jgi:hypothetical protein
MEGATQAALVGGGGKVSGLGADAANVPDIVAPTPEAARQNEDILQALQLEVLRSKASQWGQLEKVMAA